MAYNFIAYIKGIRLCAVHGRVPLSYAHFSLSLSRLVCTSAFLSSAPTDAGAVCACGHYYRFTCETLNCTWCQSEPLQRHGEGKEGERGRKSVDKNLYSRNNIYLSLAKLKVLFVRIWRGLWWFIVWCPAVRCAALDRNTYGHVQILCFIKNRYATALSLCWCMLRMCVCVSHGLVMFAPKRNLSTEQIRSLCLVYMDLTRFRLSVDCPSTCTANQADDVDGALNSRPFSHVELMRINGKATENPTVRIAICAFAGEMGDFLGRIRILSLFRRSWARRCSMISMECILDTFVVSFGFDNWCSASYLCAFSLFTMFGCRTWADCLVVQWHGHILSFVLFA